MAHGHEAGILRVLIVEDDAALTRALAGALRGNGLQVDQIDEGRSAVRLGTLILNRSNAEVQINGERVEFRRREFAVLEALLVRQGKLVLRERLATEIFGEDDSVTPNALEVQIARVRGTGAVYLGCIPPDAHATRDRQDEPRQAATRPL